MASFSELANLRALQRSTVYILYNRGSEEPVAAMGWIGADEAIPKIPQDRRGAQRGVGRERERPKMCLGVGG